MAQDARVRGRGGEGGVGGGGACVRGQVPSLAALGIPLLSFGPLGRGRDAAGARPRPRPHPYHPSLIHNCAPHCKTDAPVLPPLLAALGIPMLSFGLRPHAHTRIYVHELGQRLWLLT
jgi:hypothetical protein